MRANDLRRNGQGRRQRVTENEIIPLLERTTLRDFYATDNRSTAPSALDLARQQELLAVEFNGRPLGVHPMVVRNGKIYSTVLEKEMQEGWSVVRLLLAAEMHPISVISCSPPHPDNLVTFRDGTEQYVESTILTDARSARRRGHLEKISTALREQFAENTDLRAVIGQHYVRLKFAELPRTRDILPCVRAFAEFLRLHPLPPSGRAPYKSIGPHKLLQQYEAKYEYAPSTPRLTIDDGIVRPASSAGIIEAFQRTLAQKQATAYDVEHVWLAMTIDDAEQSEAAALDALRPLLVATTLGQFQRILVGYERGAVVL